MTADPVDPLWLRPVVLPAALPNLAVRHSADVRQAQEFMVLIEAEMVDLQEQLTAIDGRVNEGRPGALHHQSVVRARLNEVRRLLDGLIFRFPSA